MSITNTTNSVTHTGNASTTSWPYTFKIPDADSIVVQIVADYATAPVITVLTSSDYTVTGLGTDNGGTVTYPTSGTPLPATSQLQIIREVPATQTINVSNQTSRDAQVVEKVWDKLTMIAQDTLGLLTRTMKVKVGATGGSITVGSENTMPKWDANGNLIEGPTATSIEQSETNAAASAAAAEAAKDAAELALDTFDDRMLGSKASDPTLDNDGNALLEGAQYWNTTTKRWRTYNGTGFEDDVNATNMASVAYGVTSKTVVADNDHISVIDSQDSNSLKKISWSNFKVAVATYVTSAVLTLTNKTIDAANNTITNLQTSMFATNVIDTDTTLNANSDTRIASQKATKAYVDTIKSGLLWKDPVDVATTANITLSGEQTIDGVLTSTSRVLVKDQTDQTENGLYLTGAGAWTRTSGGDSAGELHGASVLVQQGSTYADTQWQQQTDNITLGSSNIVWTQFGGAGTYTAGTGLELSGNAFGLSQDSLKAINGLTPAADRLPYYTGAAAAALATFTSYGRTLLGLADAAALRSNLNVEDGADVTDAANVGSSIHGATAKTTPVDADKIGIIDSAASNALKTLSFANLKTYLNGIYVALSTLTTKGDIFVRTASGVARLGVGTNGQVLKANSAQTAGVEWANESGSTGIDDQATSTIITILNTGDVGVGVASPNKNLQIHQSDSDECAISLTNLTTGSGNADGLYIGMNSAETAYFWHYENEPVIIGNNNTERARFTDAGGDFIVGGTSTSLSAVGFKAFSGAYPGITNQTTNGTYVAAYNRNVSDGALLEFYQASVKEGEISVSGTTVSYNGAHLSRWSRLPGADPKRVEDRVEVLRGSVLTNLDEMMDWRGVSFEVDVLLEKAVEARDEVPELKDEDGNVIQKFVPAVAHREEVWGKEPRTVAYSGNKPDGESETVEFEGTTYEGVIYTEDNEQLNKMEVSSVKGDRNVAGVFQDWDDDDDEYLNDFYCAMTGDFVIRIAKGCTVQRGDLLMSAGDGTACPQEGELADVVRSCTVAKVTSTVVTHVYSDGSYLVPCVLTAC